MNELNSALRLLNIKCTKCLDTKTLWSRRQNFIDTLNDSKNYDIYSCHDCSKGEFINNHDNIKYTIINRNDNDINTRMNIIRPILSFIESKKYEIENVLDRLYNTFEWTYFLNQNYTNVITKKDINNEIYKIKKHIIENTKNLDKNIINIINNLKIIITNDNANYRLIERNKNTCLILTINSKIIQDTYYCCFKNTKILISINYKIVKSNDFIINKIFTDLF